MTTNPYQDVAKEFLDLWQKQMTSVMSDKRFIHAMLELFQNMQPINESNAKPNTAAAYTADTSDVERLSLAEFTFRLAMCEKRLAALESGKSSAQSRVRRATGRNSSRSKKTNK